ncbi:hypothetical protein DSL72_007810 [Monilinia vaccinii-corymbosi]|uniref:Cyanovirin-N domain-containing protein n=1 Tax=Monilinia vaccinii-corymbosi TaxID=61207 RepID=A0A8A3PI58_9HELO|nr:hypothetical protein DSL72_007810 [Monilinia vaccinii-corymbosi]
MHFTQATSAILATITLSSAVFAGVLQATDTFCPNSDGCVWENPASWPGVYECSCNQTPPNKESKLLMQMYTDKDYEGFLYNGYGVPGECVNMPALFDRNTESFNINTETTPGCWLYTVPDCPADQDYAVVGKNGTETAMGIYYKGVRSWICDPLTS